MKAVKVVSLDLERLTPRPDVLKIRKGWKADIALERIALMVMIGH